MPHESTRWRGHRCGGRRMAPDGRQGRTCSDRDRDGVRAVRPARRRRGRPATSGAGHRRGLRPGQQLLRAALAVSGAAGLQERERLLRGCRSRRADPHATQRPRSLPALRQQGAVRGAQPAGRRGCRAAARRQRRLQGERRRLGQLQDGAHLRGQGALGLGPRRQARARRSRRAGRPVQPSARERLRHLPRGRDQHRGHAGQGADLLRRGEGLPRRPHAHDGLRVPRRQRALRASVEPLRRDRCARGLPRPSGHGQRRGAGERPGR